MQVCPHPSYPGTMAVCGEGQLLVLEFDSENSVKERRVLRAPLIPTDYVMEWLPVGVAVGLHHLAITTTTTITILDAHDGADLPSFSLNDAIAASTFSDSEVFVLTAPGDLLRSAIIDVPLNFALETHMQVATSKLLHPFLYMRN